MGLARMAEPQVGMDRPDSCHGVPAIRLFTAERVANPTPRFRLSSSVQIEPQEASRSAKFSAENPHDSTSASARRRVSSVSSVNWPARRPE